MISSTELREKARTLGIPESTIERDYAQNWLVKSIHALDMDLVLKGGTGIRKAHIPGYRFSDDLDFTMLKDTSEEAFKNLIVTAVGSSKEESGIDFAEEVALKENPNGYEGIVYFRFLRSTGSRLRIKLDITKHNMEKISLNPEERKIIHPYSDDCTSMVLVYPLEEIVAEKLRALFERTRPRDLYDVWYMRDKLNYESISYIFSEKCRFKKVKPDFQFFIARREDFERAWENSLRHQLNVLPNFNSTFDEVLDIVKAFMDFKK